MRIRIGAAGIAVVLVAGLGSLPTPAPALAAPDRGVTANADTQRAARASVRKRVVVLVNKRRVNNGCRPLKAVPSLGKAAQRHTRRMAKANSLDHQLPGEPSLGRRVTKAGYRGWTRIGENIAYGYSNPASVVRAWMQSAGHRRNILDCRFRHTGVGFARSNNGTPYWTQDFGRK